MKPLIFASFFFFVFSGCDPVSNETGCSENSDCRFGRQCVLNICIGELNLVNSTNNGVSNNGYYSNNGYSNNGYYTNNQTVSVCRIGPDCGVDEACIYGVCTDSEIASVLGRAYGPGKCNFHWQRGLNGSNGIAQYDCTRGQNGNTYDCFCFVEVVPNDRRENDFRAGENACDDYDQIEQDMNDYCGTRFRDTFAR